MSISAFSPLETPAAPLGKKKGEKQFGFLNWKSQILTKKGFYKKILLSKEMIKGKNSKHIKRKRRLQKLFPKSKH